jgi:hypothetical protein
MVKELQTRVARRGGSRTPAQYALRRIAEL